MCQLLGSVRPGSCGAVVPAERLFLMRPATTRALRVTPDGIRPVSGTERARHMRASALLPDEVTVHGCDSQSAD